MACSVTACWDMRDKNLDYDELRKLTGQMREVSPNYLADYYPLTEYSLKPDAWIAWQYDNPEKGTGVVHAFRRDQNQEGTQALQLHGLDRDAQYVVKNFDGGNEQTLSGAELEDNGLSVELEKPRSAALYSYHKAAK
jgi:alpha-galactosidase